MPQFCYRRGVSRLWRCLVVTLAACSSPPPARTSPGSSPLPALELTCASDADCDVIALGLTGAQACCSGCAWRAASKPSLARFRAACAATPAASCPPIDCAIARATARCERGQCAHAVVTTSSAIEIVGDLAFAGATARLRPEAARMLDTIAQTLAANPELVVVEVRASGSDAAPADALALGETRARLVVGELVARGIAPDRLRATGVAGPLPGPKPLVPVFVVAVRRD